MSHKNLLVIVLCSFLFWGCNGNPKNKTWEKRQNKTDQLQIALQPFGNVSNDDLRFIQLGIDSTFSVHSKLLAKKDLPAMAWYAPRQRYVADSILQFLKATTISPSEIVIGICTKDIATQKSNEKNFGIMGLGFQPGRFCVVSSFRLQRDLQNHQHLLQRWTKVALHELGHNLGLGHCVNQHCLMVDAEGKNKLDGEKDFCAQCKKQLISLGYLQP